MHEPKLILKLIKIKRSFSDVLMFCFIKKNENDYLLPLPVLIERPPPPMLPVLMLLPDEGEDVRIVGEELLYVSFLLIVWFLLIV